MIHFRVLPLVVVLALLCGSSTCSAFSSSSSTNNKNNKNKNKNKNNDNNNTPIKAVRVSITSKEYADAMSTIDAASRSGTPTDDLYDAVRVIDRNARYVYPDEASKEELWERAYGSWKLVLATGGGRFTTFKPVPIFAFAALDETNFGNGVGLGENAILLSLLGPHELVTKRRQMVINIDDVFLASRRVTGMVPSFVGESMGLGKRPVDYEASGSRPPAFVFIAASETSLVARGGSGGIAIWTRLEKDIRPAAYNR